LVDQLRVEVTATARSGRNEMHFTAFSPGGATGNPQSGGLSEVGEFQASAGLPIAISRRLRSPSARGPGHWIGSGVNLPIRGDWN
jgi:hypothetical protein